MRAAAILIFFAAWLASGSSLLSASLPETRIALVIGNSRYLSGVRLPNAQRDADTVADTL